MTPVSNNPHVAVGLVRLAPDELWFEGDVDGNGTVSVVHYYLDTTSTNNCPCLRRSQLPKVNGNPYTGQTVPAYQIEVQGVLNTNIFAAYMKGQTGTAVTLPVNYTTDAVTISNIDTIQAIVTVQAGAMDPQTKVKPINTLTESVRLSNCSLAASNGPMSCY